MVNIIGHIFGKLEEMDIYNHFLHVNFLIGIEMEEIWQTFTNINQDEHYPTDGFSNFYQVKAISNLRKMGNHPDFWMNLA